jgi:hypothetical protein
MKPPPDATEVATGRKEKHENVEPESITAPQAIAEIDPSPDGSWIRFLLGKEHLCGECNQDG